MIAEERLVVDASVVVKWFFQEELSAEAQSLMADPELRIAPQFLMLEVANVLLKKVRRGETTSAYADRALTLLPGMLSLLDTGHLVNATFAIASRYGRTSYDALYVALAVDIEARLVTADEHLYNALQPHLPDTMVLLRDPAS